MNPALQQFLKSLQAANKSPLTLENYQRDLQGFMQFLSTTELWGFENNQAWSKIKALQVQAFIAERMQQGISASTLARQLSAIRSFYRFLIAEEVVENNPASSVHAPKQPKPLPKSVNVDLTQQLLEQSLSTWQDVRDQAMFELLYSGGIRLAELVGLDLSPGLDQLDEGWVLVLGKGGKERRAPVGSKALDALKNWLSIRSLYSAKSVQAVFVSRLGKRISPRTVQLNLAKKGLESGLPTRVSPHRLRHACATHVLESSGDLRAVQEMLGHANLSTTQIYTRLDLQHLAKVYDQAHPRAKKK